MNTLWRATRREETSAPLQQRLPVDLPSYRLGQLVEIFDVPRILLGHQSPLDVVLQGRVVSSDAVERSIPHPAGKAARPA